MWCLLPVLFVLAAETSGFVLPCNGYYPSWGGSHYLGNFGFGGIYSCCSEYDTRPGCPSSPPVQCASPPCVNELYPPVSPICTNPPCQNPVYPPISTGCANPPCQNPVYPPISTGCANPPCPNIIYPPISAPCASPPCVNEVPSPVVQPCAYPPCPNVIPVNPQVNVGCVTPPCPPVPCVTPPCVSNVYPQFGPPGVIMYNFTKPSEPGKHSHSSGAHLPGSNTALRPPGSNMIIYPPGSNFFYPNFGLNPHNSHTGSKPTGSNAGTKQTESTTVPPRNGHYPAVGYPSSGVYPPGYPPMYTGANIAAYPPNYGAYPPGSNTGMYPPGTGMYPPINYYSNMWYPYDWNMLAYPAAFVNQPKEEGKTEGTKKENEDEDEEEEEEEEDEDYKK